MVNLALLAFILQASWISTLPEESFIPLTFSNEDDDNMYLVMDTRSETDPKDSETRRRSTLDKNFARFGRGNVSPLVNYDYDFEYGGANYARPTRSGGNSGIDKNDHFIRFGRGGKSDFIRFGRDPYKLSRVIREKDSNFIRFGRSVTNILKEKVRNKRSASLGPEENFYKRQNGNNFVRFGRTPNSNFLRFGREPEESQGIHYSHLPTTAASKLLTGELQRQSNKGNIKNEYILQLLLELMRKMQQQPQVNLSNPNSIRLS